MLEGCVCAVFLRPVRGGPCVVIEVADAGVVGGDPVVGREVGFEDMVHVFVDGEIGVEEDAGGLGG